MPPLIVGLKLPSIDLSMCRITGLDTSSNTDFEMCVQVFASVRGNLRYMWMGLGST